MTVLNEMLSELVPGKEDASDVQLLTVSSLKYQIIHFNLVLLLFRTLLLLNNLNSPFMCILFEIRGNTNLCLILNYKMLFTTFVDKL